MGRAPHTKETLPDFREKCRVTRHSRAFRGLTGSQRTPGFRASQRLLGWKIVLQYRGVQGKNCIAILVLYCDLKGLKGCFFVLQYTWCIVAKKGLGAENCIAIQLLYCNLGRL